MRSQAVIPPMLLDERQKKLRFINNNGLLDDPKAINEEILSKTHYWTDAEKEIFRDKYLHRPKNFGYISSALYNKVRCFLLTGHTCIVLHTGYICIKSCLNVTLMMTCLSGSVG